MNYKENGDDSSTEGRADITLGSRVQGRRSAGALHWHQASQVRAVPLLSLVFLLYCRHL